MGARYAPADDTGLLVEVLSQSPQVDRFLEIGFGSGAVLDSVSSRFCLVVGTDVLPLELVLNGAAPEAAKVERIIADGASCFRDETFDLVAFNPPYLPSDELVDVAVDGGEGGIEVALRFLRDSIRVLRTGGKVLVLLSSESDLERFRKVVESMGMTLERRATRALFYEELVVFELRRAGE